MTAWLERYRRVFVRETQRENARVWRDSCASPGPVSAEAYRAAARLWRSNAPRLWRSNAPRLLPATEDS